ncbi:MAG TPA: cytochrome d ubiquinol oxidase subunit II [Anaerolineales bacterium]|nr:cytochrome d ubiquinol oxidase subunit II [Anaerolineales bacterium]
MYETIWFILWGVLWAVYFMLDGFDLGIGTLMPFLARNDEDRRYMYNAMGPFWDGNEVWLITAGGVTFAAFPTAYAIMFNGLYSALLLLLFALIGRGVTFEFRNKVESQSWRNLWDFFHVVGSFLPALLLGVAFANIFAGLPLDKDGVLQGGFFTLLNPYGILGGMLFVAAFMTHGALWLAVKTQGDLRQRALDAAAVTWKALLVIAVLFLAFSWVKTDLYDNYMKYPYLWIIPIVAVGALLATRTFIITGQEIKAWISSAITIVFITFFGVAGLFPRLLPSSISNEYHVTIWNASSSELTLKIMLGVVLVMVPIVIAYQTWVYLFLGKKLSRGDLEYEEAY